MVGGGPTRHLPASVARICQHGRLQREEIPEVRSQMTRVKVRPESFVAPPEISISEILVEM